MERVGVAIIGTGFIGPVHVEAVRRNGDLAEVRAIAGSSADAAKAVAEQLTIPVSAGDYRNLLNRKDIDAVHICSPNHLHYSMVKDALLAGKHVLCEKPLTLTSEEARELVGIARDSELKTAVNYNLRYYPMIREIRERNAAGNTGRLFAVNGSYLQDWLIHDNDYNWRLESGLSGRTRAVADIGTHWMDMVQHVTDGRITRVSAVFARMHESRRKPAGGPSHSFSGPDTGSGQSWQSYNVDTEDHAHIHFSMDNGVQGSLNVSQVAAGYKNYMEYRQFGTEGSYGWNSEAPNRLFIGRRDEANGILMKDPGLLTPGAAALSEFPGGHQEGYGDTMKQLFREFYRGIVGISAEPRTPALPSFEDGESEARLCEAILNSAENGGWTEVMQ